MRPMPPDGVPDPAHLPALNESFYTARPQDYFGRRLQDLMLVAGNLAGLDDLFAKGVSFGALSAIGPQMGNRPAPQIESPSISPRCFVALHTICKLLSVKRPL